MKIFPDKEIHFGLTCEVYLGRGILPLKAMVIKRFKSTIIHLLLLILPAIVYSQQPIGQWRDHLPFHSSIAVCKSENEVTAASPNGLFTIQLQDNSIDRKTKANGLTRAAIQTIGCDPSAHRIVVAYKDNTIDIIDGSLIRNIDAIQRAPISAGKTINHILVNNNDVFVSTGFGIVWIDLESASVLEQYIIGSTGQVIEVNASSVSRDSMFAATSEGLKLGTGANLQDFRSWSVISPGFIRDVELFNQQIFFVRNDSLFRYGPQVEFVFTEPGLRSIDQVDQKLAVIIRNNQTGKISLVNSSNVASNTLEYPLLKDPRQVAGSEQDLYVADSTSGLLHFEGGQAEQLNLNSPLSISRGNMIFHNGELIVSSGGINTNGQPLLSENGIYRYKAASWTNVNTSSNPVLNGVRDITALAVSPLSNTLFAGSFGKGLVEINGEEITVYNSGSFIAPAVVDNTSYRVTGLAFDSQNNLWIANDGALENLMVRKAEGSVLKFIIPFSLRQNAVGQLLVDNAGQVWIIGRNGDGLICFNPGASLENTGDDQWKWFKTGAGNGNLPDMKVLAIEKDKFGFIWVATARGVAVFTCPDLVFTNQGCDAHWPIIQQGSFAGFLLRDQYVQSIAIDGDNRKWFGAKSGAFLISSDGELLLEQFTATNSSIAGNDINAIAIDPVTGEVYFSTENGISSYRGTATEAVNNASTLLIFPNPVPPGYDGTIGIRGLPANSVVKITETNGRLVYEARSAGGQVVWNGKDYKGRAISSGVYLVLVTRQDKKENLSSKIVILKK